MFSLKRMMWLAAVVGWLQGPPVGPLPQLRLAAAADGAVNSGSETAEGSRSPSADSGDLESLLDLADQDVGQLSKVNVAAPSLDVEVSTVSRQTSTVGRSPAAVFVITNEMIRRSGARSLPDVLRMAPGVQVSRIDASKWAISIRGFNGRFANKLLVQIDGRSVYTPLFGGVVWDKQNVVLEDIERIEIVRGPGATVWGANAVNGIINIITKNARDTLGALAQGGAGTEERGFATARYGGQVGEDFSYRIYGQWFERDRGYAFGDRDQDDWRMGQGGFRADWTPTLQNHLTFQGDVYSGAGGRQNQFPSLTPPTYSQRVIDDDDFTGGNGLVRWTQTLSERSDWSIQLYYDRTERKWPVAGFREDRDTVDVDFQHRFPLAEPHSLIWGFGYRNTRDRIRTDPATTGMTIRVPERALDLFSCFVQDEIALEEDRWYLTIGSKFEHYDFAGFQYQPTARLLWTPSPRHSLWASVSRAVRMPTRAEADLSLLLGPTAILPPPPPPAPPLPPTPVFAQLIGNPNMEAEELMAYEAGIRAQPTEAFSWDAAVFFNDYENLRGLDFGSVIIPGFPTLLPAPVNNDLRAKTYGFECITNYELMPNWRIYGAYSFLVINGRTGSDGGDPRNHAYVQSSWDLPCCWQFDLIWRWVDSFTVPTLTGLEELVPSYDVLDVRLAWHARPGLELAVVGRNLLDESHPEFVDDPFLGNAMTEVQREVYGMVTWRY